MRAASYLPLPFLVLLAAGAPSSIKNGAKTPPADAAHFDTVVQPFLAKTCYGCHNTKLKSGGIDLASFKTAASVSHDPEVWEKVSTKIQDGTMPPKGMPRPAQSDIQAVSRW